MRRARVARLAGVLALSALLGLALLLFAPDRDAAIPAVDRTPHGVAARPLAGVGVGRRTAGGRARRATRGRITVQAAGAGLPVATVTLAPGLGRAVPVSYLGISTEYWALPIFETHAGLFQRALAMLRTPGDGPLVLRVGGDSADHTFWKMRLRHVPRWVVDLNPLFLRQLSALVSRVGTRLILDLNLVTDSPLSAARWARAASTSLPAGSILGFEVGNEPDLYARRYWVAATSRRALGMAVLPRDLSPAVYTRDFQAYSATLAQVAPHIPLVGPAVANPASDLGWVSNLMASPHPRLGIVSGHVYPYSACARRTAATHPTIPRVLSENATAGISGRLRPAISLAHRAGLPFRLTEINSVTCGGQSGVSDTFATALWAPDALFELMRAGADGASVHVRAHAINAAFSLSRRGMTAHPLFYGLSLFSRTLGPGARLTSLHVRMRAQAHRAPHVKVWAVRVRGGGLHVLIIDKGAGAVRVDLRIPGRGFATVQRLLAPSVRSRSGVTLTGQSVGADASWHGARAIETVAAGARGYVVTVPGMSAALVGMQLGPVGGVRTRAGAIRPGSADRRTRHRSATARAAR